MTKALKITTDRTISTVDVDELADYQREVGGYIEAVPLGDDHTLILDEEGKLKSAAPNMLATAIAFYMHAGIAAHDIIVGTALIVSSPADSPDWGDPSPALETEIRALAEAL